jgi:hypothetical protein
MFDTDGMRVGVLSAEHAVDDRAERLARLELVRSGVTTAATLAHERTLPVAVGLRELVPSGVLQRGSTLAAHGPGATSLSLAMAAEAVRTGSFLAIVAPTTFGLGACLDFGIPLRRVVQFALPAPSSPSSPSRRPDGGAGWAQLVAAVIEGFDLVVVADRRRITASQARQLVARNRERGSVLLRAGGPSWPDAPDVRYDLHEPRWSGLGQGHGHLRERALAVKVAGRRWHGSHQLRHLLLSGERGAEVVEAPPEARSGVIRPATVTPLRPVVDPVDPIEAEPRFAGADIDELLEAVDDAGRDATGVGHPLRGHPAPGRRFGTVA